MVKIAETAGVEVMVDYRRSTGDDPYGCEDEWMTEEEGVEPSELTRGAMNRNRDAQIERKPEHWEWGQRH